MSKVILFFAQRSFPSGSLGHLAVGNVLIVFVEFSLGTRPSSTNFLLLLFLLPAIDRGTHKNLSLRFDIDLIHRNDGVIWSGDTSNILSSSFLAGWIDRNRQILRIVTHGTDQRRVWVESAGLVNLSILGLVQGLVHQGNRFDIFLVFDIIDQTRIESNQLVVPTLVIECVLSSESL